MNNTVKKSFSGKIRTRACCICIRESRILLIKMRGLGENGSHLWLPPGGGVHFGEHLRKAAERELYEECGIKGKARELLFTYEFIRPPLHALEFFFICEEENPSQPPELGYDPELEEQLIEEVRFLSFNELQEESSGNLHGLFKACKSIDELLSIRGFFAAK